MRKGITPVLTFMLITLIMLAVVSSISFFIINQQEEIGKRLSGAFGDQLEVTSTVCNERNLSMKIVNTANKTFDAGYIDLLVYEEGMRNNTLSEEDVIIGGEFQQAGGESYFNRTMNGFFRSGKEFEITLSFDTGKEVKELCRGGYNWWDRDWLYRKNIMINNTEGYDFKNAVLEIDLDTRELIQQGKMRSDCLDLRVVERTTRRKMDIESGTCNQEDTTVKFRANVTKGYNADIYFYYGNLRGEEIQTRVANPVVGNQKNGDKLVDEETVINNYTLVQEIVSEQPGESTLKTTAFPENAFKPNDEVLVLQMTDSGGNVGTYDFERLKTVGDPEDGSREVTLFGNLSDGGDSGKYADGEVQLVNIPQYGNLVVDQGGIITAEKWDGKTGGVVGFRSSQVDFEGGVINVTGKGYSSTSPGPGTGGVAEGSCTGGGGGGHDVEGGAGGGAGCSNGGSSYGVENTLTLGSSGGSAGGCSPGAGGGIAFISSASVNGANVSADGTVGEGNCGGGSGGRILMMSTSTITPDSVTLSGKGSEGDGGKGSVGIMNVDVALDVGGADVLAPTEELQEIVGYRILREEER